MWLIFFRLFVIITLVHAGYVYAPFTSQPLIGAALGLLSAGAVITFEMKARSVPGHNLVGALVGGVTGLVGAHLTWGALQGVEIVGEHFVHVFLVVLLIYMGVAIGAQHGDWFEPARIIAAFRDSSRLHQYKILDTSVIIDGRIADICETGFLEGTLVAPQFVLRELQQVADSSDSLKRNRGRRGLDVLQKIQKMGGVHVQIVETDFPEIREVDLKLIELARRLDGKIVTNDFNLNKVAQLRGVHVLNINELANSLKPVVLPGELMRVFILKEGKEPGQGVGYLDDGTMVVVDQGKRAIGRTIDVAVTSVLQTTAGKMIFCRWPESGGVGEGSDPGRDSGRIPRLRDERRNGRERTDRFQSVDRSQSPATPAAATAPSPGAETMLFADGRPVDAPRAAGESVLARDGGPAPEASAAPAEGAPSKAD
jgi:uncharacterized protein YacL